MKDLLKKMTLLESDMSNFSTKYELGIFDSPKVGKNGKPSYAVGYMYDDDDNEIPVRVEFDYVPSSRRVDDPDDPRFGPGDEESLEVTSVTGVDDGTVYPLDSIRIDTDQLLDGIKGFGMEESQINELSPATKARYVSKATYSGDANRLQAKTAKSTKERTQFERKAKNRDKGVERALADDVESVDDFVRRGGVIKRAAMAKPRKAERWDGSHHIAGPGAAASGRAGQLTGRGANANPKSAGKPVVMAGKENSGRPLNENMNDKTFQHILKRFPYEVKTFKETGELEDVLFDALFDYYCDAGEMPYGVMKARTGDPFNWISDRLDMAFGTDRPGRVDGVGDVDEAVEAWPEDDCDDDAYCCTYCGNEVPPGVEPSMFDCCGERGHVSLISDMDEGMGGDIMPMEDADSPAVTARKAYLASQKAKDMAFQKAGEQWSKGFRDPFAGETRGRTGDEMAWRSQQGGIAFHEDEESFDPAVEPGEDVLTEVSDEDKARVEAMLTDIGLDDGLDFFFDGDDLVVIGRSTARLVINTVGGHIIDVDGEEVRISATPRKKATADAADVAQLAAVPDVEEAVTESVQLNINADGEDDVLAIIKKLSGLTTDTASDQQALPSMVAALDAIEGVPGETVEIGGDDEEVEEAEYANEPDPQVHTSTTQMINQGDDLNRPKKQGYPLRPLGNNPMAEARALMKEYDLFKSEFKK